MKEYNVAFLLSWIEQVSRETVFADERIVNVDEYVSPNFSNVVYFVKQLKSGVGIGVDGFRNQ